MLHPGLFLETRDPHPRRVGGPYTIHSAFPDPGLSPNQPPFDEEISQGWGECPPPHSHPPRNPVPGGRSTEANDLGKHEIIDLIPNGRNIPVTNANKEEFVTLITEYKMPAPPLPPTGGVFREKNVERGGGGPLLSRDIFWNGIVHGFVGKSTKNEGPTSRGLWGPKTNPEGSRGASPTSPPPLPLPKGGVRPTNPLPPPLRLTALFFTKVVLRKIYKRR